MKRFWIKIKDWFLGNYRCEDCGEIGEQYFDQIGWKVYDDGFICRNPKCPTNHYK